MTSHSRRAPLLYFAGATHNSAVVRAGFAKPLRNLTGNNDAMPSPYCAMQCRADDRQCGTLPPPYCVMQCKANAQHYSAVASHHTTLTSQCSTLPCHHLTTLRRYEDRPDNVLPS